jgi:hypothetical protein
MVGSCVDSIVCFSDQSNRSRSVAKRTNSWHEPKANSYGASRSKITDILLNPKVQAGAVIFVALLFLFFVIYAVDTLNRLQYLKQ